MQLHSIIIVFFFLSLSLSRSGKRTTTTGGSNHLAECVSFLQRVMGRRRRGGEICVYVSVVCDMSLYLVFDVIKMKFLVLVS